MQKIKNVRDEVKDGQSYFKAVLKDEMGFETIDVIGRFHTLEEAETAAWDYAEEEIDGDVWLNIIEYRMENGTGKAIRSFTNYCGRFVEQEYPWEK